MLQYAGEKDDKIKTNNNWKRWSTGILRDQDVARIEIACIKRSCKKINLNQRCQPFTGFDSLQRACASLSPDGIASLVLPPMDNAARAACSKSAGASELGEKSA
jgi:hypothetical protein